MDEKPYSRIASRRITLYNYHLQVWVDFDVYPRDMLLRQARQFIPQTPRAERIFRGYINMGRTPYKSMLYTISDIMR